MAHPGGHPRWSRRDAVAGLALLPLLAARPALAAPAQPAAFLVVGDWGKGGSPVQRQVAAAMAQAAAQVSSRFVISLGDNFYPHGVASVSDPQWRTSFEEVYAAPSLQTPWYAALGNHDYRGDPHAQVGYSRLSHRWRMPQRHYKLTPREHGVPELEVFVLDSAPLVMGRHEGLAQLVHGRLWLADRDAQFGWLETELARSTAPWKIVVGHHPVHSGGGHGSEPVLIQRLEPLLDRYGVQLYLNGHDHDLQHIAPGVVQYAGLGSGGGASAIQPRVLAGTRFARATPGFGVVTVSAARLELAFRDTQNRTLHSVTVERAVA